MNYTSKACCFFILLSTVVISCSGDRKLKISGNVSKEVQESVQSLYDFLKKRATVIEGDEKTMLAAGVFYDSAVNMFFDTLLLSQSFRERKFEDIRLQHAILYGVYKAIDYVPTDSIFVVSLKYFFEKTDEGRAEEYKDTTNQANRFWAGYLVNGKHYPLLDIRMAASGKFVYIVPLLNFSQQQDNQLSNFVKRHKIPQAKLEVEELPLEDSAAQ